MPETLVAPERIAANVTEALAIPTGTIIPFSGTSAPTGYLLCNGSVVSQSSYPNLFTIIGSIWNTGGEGGGNFRLPDLKGKSLFGKSGSSPFTSVGMVGGSETHSHGIASHTANPSHDHDIGGIVHTHSISSDGAHQHPADTPGEPVSVTGPTIATNSAGSHSHGGNTNNGTIFINFVNQTSDATAPGTNTQSHVNPFLVFNHIIRY